MFEGLCKGTQMSAIRSAILGFAFLCTSALVTFGQELPPAGALLQNPSVGANLSQFFTAKTPYEFWLACLICVLGFAIIVTLITVLRKVNARADEIARPIIVITVIIGTLILVTVGYSNDQIAPAFGLFGTIVGYMLGRLSQPSSGVQPTGAPNDSAGNAA